jgi:hypothetical protein
MLGRDQQRAETVARKTRMHLTPAKGGHLAVRLGGKVSILPFHGKNHDLSIGLVNGIKKQLGLKGRK